MRAQRHLVMALNSLSVAGWLFLATGCTTSPPYQAKSLPDQMATVAGSQRAYSFSYLCKVDGRGLGRLREWHFNGNTYPKNIAAVPVDPGRRTLTVYCEYEIFFYGGCPVWGSKETDLSVQLVSGHHYQIQHERDGGHFILWLEECDTHELVGEKQTVQARLLLPVRP